MKINKQKLIKAFEAVQPGLTAKETIEQSNSFGFLDGKIITYNDSISVQYPIDLDIEGAIEAHSFYKVLKKMKPDKNGDLTITEKDNQLIIKSGNKEQAGLVLESEMKMPLDEIDFSEKWKPLPKDFIEGLKTCLPSASRNNATPILTCVNINGNTIQTSDQDQLTEYTLSKNTKIKCLVPATSISQLIKYDIVKYMVTYEWLHFKTKEDSIFSCRIFNDTFPDIGDIFENTDGDVINFPENIIESLEKASIFSNVNSTEKTIKINIKKNRMIVKGESDVGWYTKSFKIDCDATIAFEVNPIFLKNILSVTNECIFDDEKGQLKFINENWKHVIGLSYQ